MHALHKASKNGLAEKVLSLLRKPEGKAELNSYDEEGFTPLLYAAQKGDLEITSQLLAAGAAVDLRQGPDEDGPPALFFAVFGGLLPIVNRLLAAGASMDIRFKFGDEQGYTPLLVAARRNAAINPGGVTLARRLLAAGANPRLASSNNLTTVHAAVLGNNYEVLTMLLESGALVDEQCHDELYRFATALHLAVHRPDPRAVLILIKNGANVNSIDGEGMTSLHRATWLNAPKTAQILLEAGANVNAQDNHGKTALYRAASQGHVTIIKTLLEYGADLNLSAVGPSEELYEGQGSGNHTPFHAAAQRGRVEVFEHLLHCENINIDAMDTFGRTALHVAVLYGHKDIVRMILRFRPAMDLEGGCRLLFISVFEGKVRIRGATPLHIAVAFSHAEIAEILIMAGAAVNGKTDTHSTGAYMTPLDLATERDNASMIRQLILAGADVAMNYYGLRRACLYGSIESLQTLVKGGGNVRDHYENGDTALHVAAYNDTHRSGKIKLLLEHGADVNAQDDYLGTPLHNLVKSNTSTISELKMLLEAGSDPRIVEVGNRTPLKLLAERTEQRREAFSADPIAVATVNYCDMNILRQLYSFAAALVAAGNYSWEAVPYSCLGLETALLAVAQKAPTELPQLFKRLEASVKEVVQTTLQVLHRRLPCEWELRMNILGQSLANAKYEAPISQLSCNICSGAVVP